MLTLEELKEFLLNIGELESSCLNFGGKDLKFETEFKGNQIIVERLLDENQNIDSCQIIMGEDIITYPKETEEYDLILKFLYGLDDLSEDI